MLLTPALMVQRGVDWLCAYVFLPHAGAPMARDGYVGAEGAISSTVHNLKFNLKNGRDVNGEGYTLKTYPVEVRGGWGLSWGRGWGWIF